MLCVPAPATNGGRVVAGPGSLRARGTPHFSKQAVVRWANHSAHHQPLAVQLTLGSPACGIGGGGRHRLEGRGEEKETPPERKEKS